MLTCPLYHCGRTFGTIQNVARHLSSHAAQKDEFKCAVCGDVLNGFQPFVAHYKENHARVDALTEASPKTTPTPARAKASGNSAAEKGSSRKNDAELICRACDASFSSKEELNHHACFPVCPAPTGSCCVV
jgi:hypothetical protein